MGLRGIKPEYIEKRLKALFYGQEGSGKTTACIQFPTPYLIDCEKGSEQKQYIDLLNKSGGAIFRTYDFDDLIHEIRSLMTEKHHYKTLVIDPLTIVYEDLLYKSEQKVGSDFGRHYGEANKSMNHLMNLLLRLDMNVIVTSHEKKVYGDNMKVLSNTYDCYKKLGYLFDLVFEIQKRGRDRVAVVKKSRIKSIEEMETFKFSYEEIAEKYGREILEKDCVEQILASSDQISDLKRLIDLLKISDETVQKLLDKCNSNSFEEMPYDCIQKFIDHLKQKINN